MNLLAYMMTIRDQVGDFNLEEDHKMKVMLVRTSQMPKPEHKEEIERLSPLPVKYVVKGSI